MRITPSRLKLMCAVALGACLLAPAGARAATISVTTTADASIDDDVCSLREALESANRNSNAREDACAQGEPAVRDTLAIPAGTYVLAGSALENDNAGGDLDVRNYDPVASSPTHDNEEADVTFDGAGDGPGGTVINADGKDRAIDVISDGGLSSVDVQVEDLSIADGSVVGQGVPPPVEDTVVEDGDGGAIHQRDANGTLTVLRATISDSDAQRWGGAISFSNSVNGQGAPLKVLDSELTGNSALGRGGAIYTRNSGSEGATQVYRSTLAGNNSGAAGGAIYLKADGETSHLVLVNSTLQGNSAAGGGGAVAQGLGVSIQQIVLSTIVGNTTALVGGAGGLQTDNEGQIVNLYGSILSANTAAGAAANCAEIGGDLSFDAGTTAYNIESHDTCDLDAAAPSNDLIGTDPQLEALAENGGQTRTMEVPVGSAALDFVPRTPTDACDPGVDETFPPPSGLSTPVDGIDQRGNARPAAPWRCDAGAFEAVATAVADIATPAEDDPAAAIPVLTNDTGDAAALSIASATNPPKGTVAITGGGAGLTYEPDANFCGLDSFSYTVAGGSVANVSVSVGCLDDLPVAANDSVTVPEGSGAVAVNVLANDTDVDAGPKSVSSVGDPANGTAAVTGGGTGVGYTPGPGYCNSQGGAPDTFSYTVNGGSTATVAVTVTCAPAAPKNKCRKKGKSAGVAKKKKKGCKKKKKKKKR